MFNNLTYQRLENRNFIYWISLLNFGSTSFGVSWISSTVAISMNSSAVSVKVHFKSRSFPRCGNLLIAYKREEEMKQAFALSILLDGLLPKRVFGYTLESTHISNRSRNSKSNMNLSTELHCWGPLNELILNQCKRFARFFKREFIV